MDIVGYLTASGLSQAELARQLGVSPAVVWQWINGVRPVPGKYAIPLERISGGRLSRHDIAPDLYPRDDRAA